MTTYLDKDIKTITLTLFQRYQKTQNTQIRNQIMELNFGLVKKLPNVLEKFDCILDLLNTSDMHADLVSWTKKFCYWYIQGVPKKVYFFKRL